MRKLTVFNHITLDGYFTSAEGDMSWAYQRKDDAEFNAFVANNASHGGAIVLGRVTYDLMASFWPTPMAQAQMPAVAEGMNKLQKIVFSRTLDKADWANTTVINTDMPAAVRKLKREPGPDMVILGSGSIVAQLAQEGLVDEFHVLVNPVVLGAGRTMFEGVKQAPHLELTHSRTFGNGLVLLTYRAMA
jgi:dihydrofolate reductase